jgi:hypothetical protein
MSLEREDMNRCVACGALVDGDVCDQYCEARAGEILAEREREKMLKAIEAVHRERARRREARKVQLAAILGPKDAA